MILLGLEIVIFLFTYNYIKIICSKPSNNFNDETIIEVPPKYENSNEDILIQYNSFPPNYEDINI